MKTKFVLIVLVLSLFSSGCAAVLLGGAIYAGTKLTKRHSSHPKLTEMQRRALESKEIEGIREDILRATVTVFQDRGYLVQSSDYQGGIITASSENPFLQITAAIEEFTTVRIRMRITMKDKDGVVEDAKIFAKLFDDIQTEVFRRTNIKE